MVRSVFIIIIALFLTVSVAAANVGQAKNKGQACEQRNGYLRATAGAPGDVQALVKSVNAKRKAQYTNIANKNGVAVEQVAKLTAQKLINGAPQHACK